MVFTIKVQHDFILAGYRDAKVATTTLILVNEDVSEGRVYFEEAINRVMGKKNKSRGGSRFLDQLTSWRCNDDTFFLFSFSS